MSAPTATAAQPPRDVAVEQALELLLQGAECAGTERIRLEQARGRVLAEDVKVATPVPPFTRSLRDGYALRSTDLDGSGPVTLRVRGESRAGRPGPPLAPGTACRIFTGAPLPRSADAVVMQEEVTARDDAIELPGAVAAGSHVAWRGADLAAGARALRRGTRLNAGRLGLLASLDRAYLEVARAPQVTIVSTGDELRMPGQPGPEGSIPESNGPVLSSIAASFGAAVRSAPLVADDRSATVSALRQALRGSDLVVTVGGSSVGAYDFVHPALADLDARLLWRGVAMRPGRPTAGALCRGCRVLCLPGVPTAATIAFLQLGLPLVRALQGERPFVPRLYPLRVLGSHRERLGVQAYLLARLVHHDGELCAALLPRSAAGTTTGFADAQALVVVPAEQQAIRHGERLPAVLLSEVGCR